MKNAENKLAAELFDVVKALVEKSIWEISGSGIYFSGFLQYLAQWQWGTKEEFLLDRPGQESWSFAKACKKYNLFQYFDADLRDAVRIMADSSSLEEIRLKFAAAGLMAV